MGTDGLRKSRLLFVNPKRVHDAVVTLKHDHHLVPEFDETIIVTNDWSYVFKVLQENLPREQTQKFDLLADSTLIRPAMRGHDPWIVQQMLKLAACAVTEPTDLLFLQDCDTFTIEQYNWFDRRKMKTRMLFNPMNRKFPTMDPMIHKFGLKLSNPYPDYSYVCDMMPIYKADFTWLKNLIEHKAKRNDDWACIDTIWDEVQKIDRKAQKIWFSEYHLLALWNLSVHQDILLKPQFLFRLDKRPLEELESLPANANFITFNRPLKDSIEAQAVIEKLSEISEKNS